MTDKEQAEVVGRTHIALRQARATAAILKSDIDDFSRELREAAEGLKFFLSDPIGKGPTGMLKDDYIVHFWHQFLNREIESKVREFAAVSQRVKELEKQVSEF